MYSNIYSKLKLLAKIIAIAGIVITGFLSLSLILRGLAVGFEAGFIMALSGLFVGVIGVLVSWVSTWMLYAFADMGENIEKIKDSVENGGGAVGGDFNQDATSSAYSGPVKPEQPNYYNF